MPHSSRRQERPQYQYGPLNNAAGEIRLLLIPLLDRSDFKLYYFPLIDTPNFYILLYYWGTPEAIYIIYINGADFRIVDSVVRAVSKIRLYIITGRL